MSVLVVGNAAIDRSFALERLPEPGETLLAHSSRCRLGGKGLNQAVSAARAGASVRLVAGVGGDSAADEIARYLASESVDAVLVGGNGVTDELVIMVAPNGENTVVSTAGQAQSVTPQTIDEVLQAARPGGILLLQGNLAASTTRHALEGGGARRLQRIANAAPVAFPWAALQTHVDLLIVNAVEAPLVGPFAAAKIIVTEGPAGATLIQGGQRWHVPAPRVTAVDTTGAGDVLCGVLVAALDRQMPILEALEGAVRAAALKVTREGTSSGLPTANELREILG